MDGLGGLNRTENGVIVGLLQLRTAEITTPADLNRAAENLAAFVRQVKSRRRDIDILVFPEYSLNGASKSLRDDLQCSLDGPQIDLLREACRSAKVWACFSFMEHNPGGHPYNAAILVDDEGRICLHYRKLHPWVPAEPWEPGDLGIPVCEGPRGCKIAVAICHDGMFPEVAREAAYNGAELLIRIAGYSASLRHQWLLSAQADAFYNLMYTASVCACSATGPFSGMGEAIVVGFDGVPVRQGSNKENELVTAEIRPDLVREARRTWGAEQHLPAGPQGIRGGQRRRHRLPLHLHARPGRRAVQPSLGRRGRRQGRRGGRLPPAAQEGLAEDRNGKASRPHMS